jgi:uncharacterized membrane protein
MSSTQPSAPTGRAGTGFFDAERELDRVAGYALFCGALLSLILVGAGLIGLALRPDGATLAGKPIAVALRSAFALQPAGLINLGVLILLATPLVRVVIAVVGFAALKRWRFAIISLIVLAMLLVSFFVAA